MPKRYKYVNTRQYARLYSSHMMRYKFAELSPEHFAVKHKVVENTESVVTISRDISAGGIAFLSNKPLDASSMIELEISFPAAPHPLKATAKVLRSIPQQERKYRISCEFVKIDDKDKLAIDDYINKVTGGKRQRKWWWRTLK